MLPGLFINPIFFASHKKNMSASFSSLAKPIEYKHLLPSACNQHNCVGGCKACCKGEMRCAGCAGCAYAVGAPLSLDDERVQRFQHVGASVKTLEWNTLPHDKLGNVRTLPNRKIVMGMFFEAGESEKRRKRDGWDVHALHLSDVGPLMRIVLERAKLDEKKLRRGLRAPQVFTKNDALVNVLGYRRVLTVKGNRVPYSAKQPVRVTFKFTGNLIDAYINKKPLPVKFDIDVIARRSFYVENKKQSPDRVRRTKLNTEGLLRFFIQQCVMEVAEALEFTDVEERTSGNISEYLSDGNKRDEFEVSCAEEIDKINFLQQETGLEEFGYVSAARVGQLRASYVDLVDRSRSKGDSMPTLKIDGNSEDPYGPIPVSRDGRLGGASYTAPSRQPIVGAYGVTPGQLMLFKDDGTVKEL